MVVHMGRSANTVTILIYFVGSLYQNRRKMMTAGFHFSILTDYVKIFAKETEKLVAKLSKNDITNVLIPMSQYTLSAVAGDY